MGKTALAEKYIKKYTKKLRLLMAKETANIIPLKNEVARWLREDLLEEPSNDFNANVDRLIHRLCNVNEEEKIAILIDNLEPALDANGKFIKKYNSFLKLLRRLAVPDIRSITLITSRESICENVKFQDYKLPRLDIKAWANYFGISNEQDIPSFRDMHGAYNGNALAMTIHKGAISQELKLENITAENIKAYWKQYENQLLAKPNLKNLIKEQFERLKSVHVTAYKLLYRLGCYRYQDVSSISLAGLKCLLWDMKDENSEYETIEDEDYTQEVVEVLKNRCLVEIKYSDKTENNKDEKIKYYLHPAIREEAVKRLKSSGDYKKTNRQVANFFVDSVSHIESLDDALFVLEAYYHFINIKDFQSAAKVIVQDRPSQYENFESLGIALYRLGLFQRTIPLIEKIENKEISPYLKCRIYNIKGEFYSLAGDIQKAIDNHQLSGDIAKEHIEEDSTIFSQDPRRNYKNLYVVSFYNIGICNLELWEIEEARQCFEEVNKFAEDEEVFQPYVKGSQLLSNVYCSLLQGNPLSLESRQLFDQLVDSFPKNRSEIEHSIHCQLIDFSNPWAYGFFGIIFGWIYKNLKEYEKAKSQYEIIKDQTKAIKYIQFQANSLNGLAEIYREQCNFEKAKENHNQAIELLQEIGCKRDLAEAYLQLALTYQANKEVEESKTYFTNASNLFNEIGASKQIERLQKLDMFI
jgi:tetratricopeptide (TPR) repeat protein